MGEGRVAPADLEYWSLLRFNYVRPISFVRRRTTSGLRRKSARSICESTSCRQTKRLILLERVNEAQRLATRELKEQLAAAASSGRGGGRNRKRGGAGHRLYENDDAMEALVQKELQKGYKGGSGGHGGALPNQRG